MHWLVCVGIGIVFVITIYNVFHIPFSLGLPCLIVLTVCTTSDLAPFAYAIERLWDTAIGLGVGLLINVLVLPYDNSFKIRNSIEYLKEEVIFFLEDMFDGDKQYPDTEKLTKTITIKHYPRTIIGQNPTVQMILFTAFQNRKTAKSKKKSMKKYNYIALDVLNKYFIYSYRKASIGFRREALYAG